MGGGESGGREEKTTKDIFNRNQNQVTLKTESHLELSQYGPPKNISIFKEGLECLQTAYISTA